MRQGRLKKLQRLKNKCVVNILPYAGGNAAPIVGSKEISKIRVYLGWQREQGDCL